MRKLHLAVIGALVVVVCAPLFTGSFYAGSDMRAVYIPLEQFFQDELHAGNLPAWHPGAAWGYPVIASAQIGFFYPPLLVSRLLFPLQGHLTFMVISHMAALAIGVYVFARRIGQSGTAALVSAFAFGFSGYVWQHVAHLNIALAIAWFPWQMLWMHRLSMRKKAGMKDFAVSALVLGIPFLAGQLQIPLLIAGVSTAYYVYLRVARDSGHSWPVRVGKPLRVIGITAVLAVAVAAAQLLPTAQLAQYSSRAAAGSFNIERANQHSYPLYHLPQTVFPRFFGNEDTYWGKRIEVEQTFYVGAVPLLLALWFAITGRKKRLKGNYSATDNRTITYLTWLGAITFLLALGSLSPFRLIGIEPSLWIFSAPARWLLFTTFTLALFAGFALDMLGTHAADLRAYARTAAIVLAGGALCWTILSYALTPPDIYAGLQKFIPDEQLARSEAYYTAKAGSLIRSARNSGASLTSTYTVLALIPVCALPFVIGRRRDTRVVVALTAVELTILAMTAQPMMKWHDLLGKPQTVQRLPATAQDGDARILTFRADSGDTGKYLSNPASLLDDNGRIEQKRLLLPLIHTLYKIKGVEWPASLPLRAHVHAVGNIRPDTFAGIDRGAAEHLNIGALVAKPAGKDIVIEPLDPNPRTQVIRGSGTASITHESPTDLRINVQAHQDAKLLVRDTWYPGWNAQVDGTVVPVTQAEPFFRAVDIPEGTHTIRMSYRPAALYAGIATSTAAVLLCIVRVAARSRSNTNHRVQGVDNTC